jgi:hypothetical protein
MGARLAVLLTPVESAHLRSLLSCKQNVPVSHFFSILSGHSQIIENKATSNPVESALARMPRTAHSKGLIAAKIIPQLLYLLHLRDLRESAHSKEFITPVESALTRNSSATPLESALTKMTGVGVPVFRGLTSTAARSLRESSEGSPSSPGISLYHFFQPPTFNFRLSTFFSQVFFHLHLLTPLLPCRAPLQSLRFHRGEK